VIAVHPRSTAIIGYTDMGRSPSSAASIFRQFRRPYIAGRHTESGAGGGVRGGRQFHCTLAARFLYVPPAGKSDGRARDVSKPDAGLRWAAMGHRRGWKFVMGAITTALLLRAERALGIKAEGGHGLPARVVATFALGDDSVVFFRDATLGRALHPGTDVALRPERWCGRAGSFGRINSCWFCPCGKSEALVRTVDGNPALGPGSGGGRHAICLEKLGQRVGLPLVFSVLDDPGAGPMARARTLKRIPRVSNQIRPPNLVGH